MFSFCLFLLAIELSLPVVVSNTGNFLTKFSHIDLLRIIPLYALPQAFIKYVWISNKVGIFGER